MSKNRQFNPSVECPQCGSVCEDVQVKIIYTFDITRKKWIESTREVTGNITTTFVQIPPESKCLCGRENNDNHLHRKCNCCGYYWNEGTLKDFYE
jgi:hypothetical protein